MSGLKSALLWAAVVAAVGGCASVSREPRNLQTHKAELVAYVESGNYDRDISAVAQRAVAWLEERARRGGEMAVVFDLDDTLLRNWPQLRAEDFGYIHSRWEAWVHEAKAPAIEPVREVYRAARRLGMEVVFVTSRPERHRAPTERNLQALELGNFESMICRADGDRRTNREFKTDVRRRLTEAGHVVIANIGDQESDLAGGFAERTFKVPNPFYLTE